jgi:RNA polymerase sigma-70 factor, ECF subfamily
MFSLNQQPLEQLNVDELVRTIATDPSAWERLYQQFVRQLYYYIRTHTRNNEDAADATQQVFLQAFVALQQSPPPQRFAPWLFRIARNLMINKHQRQRPTVSVERLPEIQHPVEKDDPETLLLQQEAQTTLTTLLAQLPMDKRELLALRFAGQLNSEEIALVVGKSPAAVKRQLTRIIHQLKESYHEA